jgi:uroporphyrinogen decarboxylase
MSALKNTRLIRALLKQPVDCTPVWIMRQAGRYLPEYRKVRAKAGDFMALCKTPELACEVTLQPIRRFPLDAAIVFSDILTIPDAMGLGLQFVEGEGPQFAYPVRSESDIAKLAIPDPELELGYVMEAIRLIKKELYQAIPLIGFAGSPWTLATYMVEGGSSKTFAVIKALLYQSPAVLHALLDKLADSVILYLNAQIAAGADVVMIFDTWGGVLTTPHYACFSLEYMKKIVQGLHRQYAGRQIPVIVFTKGGGLWLEKIAEIGCDALSLDWTINLSDAKARVGDRVALQGNLDPGALYASPEVLRQEVNHVLQQYGVDSGHVFNLGHGISPDVNPDNVAILVDAVHALSAELYKKRKL